jgi:hypothetical protein
VTVIDRLTILPNQYTHLVANVVKNIRLKESSSPHPNHILITFHLLISKVPKVQLGTHKHFDPSPKLGFGTSSLDRIDWNPIAPSDKDSLVVDFKIKRCTLLPFEGVLDELNASEADLSGKGVDDGAVLRISVKIMAIWKW